MTLDAPTALERNAGGDAPQREAPNRLAIIDGDVHILPPQAPHAPRPVAVDAMALAPDLCQATSEIPHPSTSETPHPSHRRRSVWSAWKDRMW